MLPEQNQPVSFEQGIVLSFEHLFPGVKWSSLRSIDFNNTLSYFQILTGAVQDAELGHAIAEHRSHAHKINLPFPDRNLFRAHLASATPTNEKPQLAWIEDLISPWETLGGMGIKVAETLNPRITNLVGGLAYFLPDASVDPYLHTPTYVIGILADGRPSGLIVYYKGEKPRNGKPTLPLTISPVYEASEITS